MFGERQCAGALRWLASALMSTDSLWDLVKTVERFFSRQNCNSQEKLTCLSIRLLTLGRGMLVLLPPPKNFVQLKSEMLAPENIGSIVSKLGK